MRLPRVALLFVGCLLAAGCSSDDAVRRGFDQGRLAARQRIQRAGADTLRFAAPDAVPGDRQLPEPVRLALRKPLESWTQSWRLALPDLRIEQFASGAKLDFTAVPAVPYDGSLDGEELRLQHLVVPSPVVWLLVDPFLDLELETTDEGGVRALHIDEPGVAVVDLRARTERRVLALPTGSSVDGAHWIDEQRFIVLADEPSGGGRRPVMYLVHVAAGNAVRYAGPVAPAADARTARTELDRRFRAARPDLELAARE